MMFIDSDFEDYYDAALRALRKGPYWNRRRRKEPSRFMQFEQLQALGWPVVPHGLVTDICSQIGPEHHVVVYRDRWGHGGGSAGDGGEPLVFASRDEALMYYRDMPCSFYALNTDQSRRVISMTQLVIGHRRFELVYRQTYPFGSAPMSWASNRGSFEVMVTREIPARGFDAQVEHPLWSVDYVLVDHHGNGTPVPTAFDFNTAPMLAHTGISRLVSAEDVARLIIGAWNHYKASRGNGATLALDAPARNDVLHADEDAPETEESQEDDEPTHQTGGEIDGNELHPQANTPR